MRSSDHDGDIEINAFVPGNDVFPGIDIKLILPTLILKMILKMIADTKADTKDDTTDDDSVVIVEELSSRLVC